MKDLGLRERQLTELIKAESKSCFLAFVLAFFLGPLSGFYVSFLYGFLATIFTLFVVFLAGEFGAYFCWILFVLALPLDIYRDNKKKRLRLTLEFGSEAHEVTNGSA